MNSFAQHLDRESEDALRDLAHSVVQFVYSSSAQMIHGSSSVTMQELSVQIAPKKFVIIENDWDDTPEEWHDYYFLQARIGDRPKEVTVKESANGAQWEYTPDHFGFSLGPESKVSKLEILSERHIGETESVVYDAGILVRFESGQDICIIREESIAGFLILIHDPEEIASAIEGLHRRQP